MHLIIPSECRLRVFVTAKQEVFEFYDNAEHMLHRHTFSYGESIIQLLETWKETDEPLLQEAYEYLKKRAQVGEENMGEWNEILFRFQHVDNPFLYLLVMQLHRCCSNAFTISILQLSPSSARNWTRSGQMRTRCCTIA